MFHNTRNRYNRRATAKGSGAFVLVEVLMASMVAIYIFFAAWSVYIMVHRWWAETLPRIEVQRAARIALTAIIEGANTGDVGSVSMTDGPTDLRRRYGLAWTVSEPDTSTPGEVYFTLLDSDSANARGFKMAADGNTQAVYLKKTDGTWKKIQGTSGITSLSFAKESDARGKIVVTVTVTAQREVRGTRLSSHVEACVYTDKVFLRNYAP